MFPYRHTQQELVAPFIDALAANHRNQIRFRQFEPLLDTIKDSLTEGKTEGVHAHISPTHPESADQSAKEFYLSVVEQCESDPEAVSTDHLAAAVAIGVRESKQDLLGIIYEEMGCTDESYGDQYFTPPNVSHALGEINRIAYDEFDRPEPDLDNVSTGKTTLSMFDSPGEDEDPSEQAAQRVDTDGGAATARTIFDPACGTGRLGIGAAHAVEEDEPVIIGWELQRVAAKIAAINLTLQGFNGIIIQGNALRMEAGYLHRVTQSEPAHISDYNPTKELRGDIPSSSEAEDSEFNALQLLQSPAPEEVDEAIGELIAILENGFDHGLTNPPFTPEKIEDMRRDRHPEMVGRIPEDYETATQDYASGKLRNSQKAPWLFAELLKDYLKPDGAGTIICPSSLQANPSQEAGRDWFMDRCGYLESSLELPSETFAPETKTKTGVMTFKPRPAETHGVEVDYEVKMAVIEAVGHDTSGDEIMYVPDGDDTAATISMNSLSDNPFYTLSRWLGDEGDEMTLPDDDLPAFIDSHRREQATS